MIPNLGTTKSSCQTACRSVELFCMGPKCYMLYKAFVVGKKTTKTAPSPMAALRSRCGHSILQLWFPSFFLLVFFLASSQRSQIGCLPHFHTRCGLSANLEKCMSEMCCTWLAEITGRKNDAKNRHLGTIAQFCRSVSSQLRHVSTPSR